MNRSNRRALAWWTLMACAALAACGGGGASADDAEDSEAAAMAAPKPAWTPIANEGQAFKLKKATIVRFGAKSKWVTKTVASKGRCTSAFFGRDPIANVAKRCEVSSTSVHYGDLKLASLGIGANLNGALAFPATNAWNRDISAAPRDPNSEALIASIGSNTPLRNDFGAGLWEGAPIGIPYMVVAGKQKKVTVTFTDYEDESDLGPYPIPSKAPVEGGVASRGDRHVIVIDRDSNRLYEMGNAYRQGDGTWQASGGAIFHLDSNKVRPTGQAGWTSADAAGLPIFPGLVRYEEAALGPGGIRHAIRFTASRTRRAYVPPATHWASGDTNPNLPPMGMRVRLKASYAIPTSFSTETRALLTAMKTYGMLLADNGSNWYLSGAPDERWNNSRLISELGQVKGRDFEVVRMDGIVTP